MAAAPTILTIGHSNHTWDSFAPLLKRHGIQVLVDVRTNPASRFAPFSNRRTLETLLENEGIRYVYMGDTLGGKPTDRSLLNARERPDYDKLRSMASFREGIDELMELADSARTAIMCAEEDPTRCHRRLLLGPTLEEERGIAVIHIRADGAAQSSGSLGGKKAYRRQLQSKLPLAEPDQ